ncbi:MAG TPA: ATP-dependent helicase HrpB [Verrucomicrobiales bacterium]|jgi:ATP-dependent helicase HrpB|nr:ATP-dependent helicase HrpB [Verrucomicrobiales bacterium]
MSLLPIYEIEPALLAAWRSTPERRRFVIEAPTGSGKSTQLPQMLLKNDLLNGGEVIILQPRRIAARMLARRVAEEMGTRLGDEVGYQVRFEGAVSARTRIRYVTEGILLRRMMDDPHLRGVTAVIFDEFHERHLYGDITLARAMDVQESTRPDLAILVMSATLQTAALNAYLKSATHLVSEGRTFPVTIRYAPQRGNVRGEIWDHAARVCGDAMAGQREGHALVFMPGGYEIRKTLDALSREKWAKEFDLLPLHGELTPAQQDAAVTDTGRRRIVVATNVAETSLTIDGVRAVVDSGLARIASWDSNRGINTLTVNSISRASADQRAGRAGRTGPGVCYRLWSEDSHGRRAAAEVPEVLRLDLAEVILTLKAAGVGDLETFRWFEKPDARSIDRAVRLLHELAALDAAGAITETGRHLTRYPLHPRQARMMEAASEHGCAPAVALCVALLQGRSLYMRSAGEAQKKFQFPDDYSDFLPLLRAWQAAADNRFHPDACGRLGLNGKAASEAARLADRLAQIAGAGPNDSTDPPGRETFAKVVLSGYSDQVARRTSTGGSACDIVGGRRGSVSKDSVVRGVELLVAAEIAEVQGRDVQVTLQMLTELEEDWLGDLFPDDFALEKAPFFDMQQRRVIQRERVRFRDLVIRERQTGEADENAAAAILADEVMRGNLTLTEWGDAVDQWLARLALLQKAMPELELPVFTEEDKRLVLEELFHGRRSYKEIKDLSPLQALRDWLSPQQAAAMDRHAPPRIELATGRSAKIDYTRPEEPSVSVFIQQLFTQKDTPKIAAGRIPLVLSILAPNHRPIQVTRDLAGFWKNHYPALKKELERRYPRHEWREM